jgi:hypothetical protein
MEPKNTNQDNSEAMAYVKSLKIALKRRFAGEYLTWMRGGRIGTAPSRGTLSYTVWRNICTNLDGLG